MLEIYVLYDGHSGRAVEDAAFDRSSPELVGSNPTRGMDVSVCFYIILSCAGRRLAMG